MKKLEINDHSLAHLTLILLLHYLVKFRSSNLAVCNYEFIPDSACIDLEMINRIATNTIIIPQEVLHVTLRYFYYCMCSKCCPSARTQVADDTTRQQHVQSRPRAAYLLLMRHFSLSTNNFKVNTINVKYVTGF